MEEEEGEGGGGEGGGGGGRGGGGGGRERERKRQRERQGKAGNRKGSSLLTWPDGGHSGTFSRDRTGKADLGQLLPFNG